MSGDDARRVDPGVFARLGQTVIRHAMTERGLSVTMLLDQTASMGEGAAAKAERARDLTAALAYVAWSGGDTVRIATFDGSGVSWAPPATDVRRSLGAIRWLGERRASGQAKLDDVARATLPRLGAHGLLVLITDGWFEDATRALRRFSGGGQELLLVLVLESTEVDPTRLGGGPVRLVDVENGRSLDTVLSAESLASRRRSVQAWLHALRDETHGSGGRTVVITTDRTLEQNLLQDLVRAGVVA